MRKAVLALLLVSGLAMAQNGAYGDFAVDFGYKQNGAMLVVDGFVKNTGSVTARAVTVEAQCLEGKGTESTPVWDYSFVVKDVSGGGKRSFKFSKPASATARVQMRVVKVDW